MRRYAATPRQAFVALFALVLGASLATVPTLAVANDDQPVATAPRAATRPASAPDTSTAAQIDAYLKTSPVLVLPKDNASGVTSSGDPPRQVHGVVDVAVGSGGYRSAYVRSDFPVGETGTLSVAVQDTQFGRRYGYGYGGPRSGQSIAIGLALGGAGGNSDDRCRQGWDSQRRHRLDPAFDNDEGLRGRGCRLSPGDISTLP